MKSFKVCNKCKEEKQLDGFTINKRSKDGYDYYCRECKKEIRTKYRGIPWVRHWFYILNRCKYHKDSDYYRKGIKVKITKEDIRKLWERDKAWELKKPSIDRINGNGDYTFNNCRFIEKSLNTYLSNILNGKWAKNYNECKVCGTDKLKHTGYGLCRKCYTQMYRRRMANDIP